MGRSNQAPSLSIGYQRVGNGLIESWHRKISRCHSPGFHKTARCWNSLLGGSFHLWGLFSRDTQALDIVSRVHLRPGQLMALIHNLECRQTGTPGCLNVGIEFGNQQRKTPQSCRASPCRLMQEYQHAGSTRLKDKGALNLQHWQQIDQLRLLRVPWIKGLSKFIVFPFSSSLLDLMAIMAWRLR